MKLALKSHSAHWLLGVGVALGVASANAASGFTLTHGQESEVTTGMTAGEVPGHWLPTQHPDVWQRAGTDLDL
jgi:hypothetical protein